MNLSHFYLGLLEFILSFTISLVVLFITFKLLNKFIVKKHNVPYKNIAFAILCSAIFFSVSYLMASVKEVLTSTIRALETSLPAGSSLFLSAAQYLGLYILIALLVIGITNVASIGLFTIMTKGINEVEEIKKENIAVSIITAALMICISMMVKDSLVLILESFIPMPEIPRIAS